MAQHGWGVRIVLDCPIEIVDGLIIKGLGRVVTRVF